MSTQLHPSGFRISERPVAASFAHPYSFQPLPDYSLRDDACIPSSMSLGGVEGSTVRYWDEGSTVAVLEFKVEEPVPSTESAPVVKEKKKKQKGAPIYGSHRILLTSRFVADDSTNRPVEASTLPVSDKPVTLSFKGGFGQKQALAAPVATGPVKVVPPKTLGFSMADEEGSGEGNDEHSDLLPSDAKGLSHALKCPRLRLWMSTLTSRTMQYSPRRRSPRWSPARRYGN
jgi:RNA-binding protein 5/10